MGRLHLEHEAEFIGWYVRGTSVVLVLKVLAESWHSREGLESLERRYARKVEQKRNWNTHVLIKVFATVHDRIKMPPPRQTIGCPVRLCAPTTFLCNSKMLLLLVDTSY